MEEIERKRVRRRREGREGGCVGGGAIAGSATPQKRIIQSQFETCVVHCIGCVILMGYTRGNGSKRRGCRRAKRDGGHIAGQSGHNYLSRPVQPCGSSHSGHPRSQGHTSGAGRPSRTRQGFDCRLKPFRYQNLYFGGERCNLLRRG